jgi:hypothetical protein
MYQALPIIDGILVGTSMWLLLLGLHRFSRRTFNQVKDFPCNPLSTVIQTGSMTNSKAKVELKALSHGYCLVVDGEESEPVDYGELLEMETTDGRRFIALVEAEGEKDLTSVTEFWAYEALPVADVPIVEADDDEDDDQDEDEDDDQDDDEDEDEVEVPEVQVPVKA